MSQRWVHALLARTNAATDGIADAELLARWVLSRDEAAFELIVRRHAESVWRVCRAIAANTPAAEDAFQAAFLALVHRADGVHSNLAGWLHRVAYHAALKSRKRRFVTLSTEPAVETASDSSDTNRVVHEELNRLPEKYRLPILLCHLQGLSQQQTADRLRWPLGTVATRVARGSEQLRRALEKRGVAPVVAISALLAGTPAVALSPIHLQNTIQLAHSTSQVAPAIIQLAEGALGSMKPSLFKPLAAATVMVATACGVTFALSDSTPVPEVAKTQPPAKAPIVKPEPKELEPADFFQKQESLERMKKLGLTWYLYHDKFDHFPTNFTSPDGKPLLSWRVAILPYLDQDFLYSQFKLDEPWDSEHNKKFLKYVPRAFRSPGTGEGQTRVKTFTGAHAAMEPGKKVRFQDFTDGTVNTIMLAEAGPAIPWTKPDDLPYDQTKPLPSLVGPYGDGFATTFVDGSARWIRRTIDSLVFRLMIERDDDRVLPEFFEGEFKLDRPNVSKEGGPGVGLSEIPTHKPTERELEEAKRLYEYLKANQQRDWLVTRERLALMKELERRGELQPPELPPENEMQKIEQAMRHRNDRQNADRAETERMMKILEAKDPEAAKRLQKQFNEWFQELFPPKKPPME